MPSLIIPLRKVPVVTGSCNYSLALGTCPLSVVAPGDTCGLAGGSIMVRFVAVTRRVLVTSSAVILEVVVGLVLATTSRDLLPFGPSRLSFLPARPSLAKRVGDGARRARQLSNG